MSRRLPVLAGAALAGLAAGRAVGRAAAGRRSRGPVAVPPPLQGRRRTVRAEDGVELAVEEHGPVDAPATVVLLHGYTQSSRLWNGQVRDLLAARPDLRVVVYDHRGHGRSSRCERASAHLEQLGRDLQQVLDQVVPTGPVVLAGHSMGGMTVMALAEQRPELFGRAEDGGRVVGAAFVATSSGGLADVSYGLPAPAARVFRRVLPALNERAARDEAAGKPRRLAPGTVRLIFGAAADPADLALVREDMLGGSAETVAAFLATFADHDRAAALKALDGLPAVVVHGDRDRLCPLAHGRAIAEALGCELALHPGAGHMVQLERRPEVSRTLVRLLDRALPAP